MRVKIDISLVPMLRAVGAVTVNLTIHFSCQNSRLIAEIAIP